MSNIYKIIFSNNKSIKVAENILRQSNFFGKMIDLNMKEGASKVIKMIEEPNVIIHYIQYLQKKHKSESFEEKFSLDNLVFGNYVLDQEYVKLFESNHLPWSEFQSLPSLDDSSTESLLLTYLQEVIEESKGHGWVSTLKKFQTLSHLVSNMAWQVCERIDILDSLGVPKRKQNPLSKKKNLRRNE